MYNARNIDLGDGRNGAGAYLADKRLGSCHAQNITLHAPLPVITIGSNPSFRVENDALVFLALDHLERLQKVLPAGINGGRVLLIPGQVGVYEFDEAVEVFGRDLRSKTVSKNKSW
jgi:hypothetical protein